MDKKYIEENEIEIKYLRNQLTAEEVEEFEVYLMENPEMVEGLELLGSLNEEVSRRREVRPAFFRRLIDLAGARVLAATLGLFGAGLITHSFIPERVVATKYLAANYRSSQESGSLTPTFFFDSSIFEAWNKDKFALIVEVDGDFDGEFQVDLFKLDEGSDGRHPMSHVEKKYSLSEAGSLEIVMRVREFESGRYRIDLRKVGYQNSYQSLTFRVEKSSQANREQ